MTLNYWMIVERYPNLKEEAVQFPTMKSPLYSKKKKKTLAIWSTASCALTLACRLSISKKKRKEIQVVCNTKYHTSCITTEWILSIQVYRCLRFEYLTSTPSISKQKLRYTRYVGLRSFLAFLARNCLRCIALTKCFPVS
jgi:hypothetical protein